MSSGYCHSCAAVCSLYSVSVAQYSQRLTKYLCLVFSLYISVRLTLSDTSTNVTYKSLSGTEHVPKSGTYCT